MDIELHGMDNWICSNCTFSYWINWSSFWNEKNSQRIYFKNLIIITLESETIFEENIKNNSNYLFDEYKKHIEEKNKLCKHPEHYSFLGFITGVLA